MLARTDTEALLRELLSARAEAILALARPAIELLPARAARRAAQFPGA